MTRSNKPIRHRAVGEFRFSVIGGLLASPPGSGQLKEEIKRLSERAWLDPICHEQRRFSISSIERWYYVARNANDPVGALSSIPRRDRGKTVAISKRLEELIREQYDRHRDWTWMLHYSNIKALIKKDQGLGKSPSYTTFRRFMKANGLARHKMRRP